MPRPSSYRSRRKGCRGRRLDSMLIEEEVDEKSDAVAVETLGDAAEEEAAKRRRKAVQKKATHARAQELLAKLAKEENTLAEASRSDGSSSH
jgi:hypothetical protein